MEIDLTDEEHSLLQESLKYTKRNFENYTQYPSYEYKRKRIKEVEDVQKKLRDAWKKSNEAK